MMTPRPPKPETRERIERSLGIQRRESALAESDGKRRRTAMIERQLAELHGRLGPAAFAKAQAQFQRGIYGARADRTITIEELRKRRRPGEGGMPALVEPPRGPKPLQGGAAAPLEFDN